MGFNFKGVSDGFFQHLDSNVLKYIYFFFISNQRTVINEEKRKVQVIHDDEQQETEKPNSKTKDKEWLCHNPRKH